MVFLTRLLMVVWGLVFFWPFDNTRYFFPYHPVQVSPIGVNAFFSEYGLKVIVSELVFIILPTSVFIVLSRLYFRINRN